MNTDQITKVLAALYGMHEGTVSKILEAASALRDVPIESGEQTKVPQLHPVEVRVKAKAEAKPKPMRRTSTLEYDDHYRDILTIMADGEEHRLCKIGMKLGIGHLIFDRALTLTRRGHIRSANRGMRQITAAGLAAIGKRPKPPRVEATDPGPLPTLTVAKREPAKYTDRSPFITDHARQRYSEHHDDNAIDTLIGEWNQATPIDGGVVATMTNESKRLKGSIFRLSKDRRGIFVVAKGLNNHTMVTYLRLTETHQEWCRKHYPNGAA